MSRRVLYPFTDTVVGGSYVSASLLLRGVAASSGWEAVVVLPRAGANVELFEATGAELRFLGLSEAQLQQGRRLRLRGQLSYRLRLLRLALATLRRERPDLVHINDDRTLLTWGGAARLLGIPVVWHVRQERSAPLDPLLRRVSSHAIFIAEATRRRFAGEPPSPSSVIHNATDPERFRPAADRAAAKAALGFAPDALLMGFVGRLTAEKRPLWALRAAAALQAEYPELQLLVVGGDDARGHGAELERWLRESGADRSRIHFLGVRHDVPEIVRALDVQLVPSLSEPFGLVVIEGMASGAAVVATRAGGVPEIVTDGVDGRLVEADDYPAFEATVAELLADPEARARLARAGRERVLRHFSPERVCREVIGVYESLRPEGTVAGRGRKLAARR